jgi:hypothetical protein
MGRVYRWRSSHAPVRRARGASCSSDAYRFDLSHCANGVSPSRCRRPNGLVPGRPPYTCPYLPRNRAVPKSLDYSTRQGVTPPTHRGAHHRGTQETVMFGRNRTSNPAKPGGLNSPVPLILAALGWRPCVAALRCCADHGTPYCCDAAERWCPRLPEFETRRGRRAIRRAIRRSRRSAPRRRGLGDLLLAATAMLGIPSCAGCRRRATWLNQHTTRHR